ncbi:MAG: family 20 glycosylhydrolase, partial [Alloprevotella sp.]|nr:family 20 glycosylhydrolase [Alloprevotella sp.]
MLKRILFAAVLALPACGTAMATDFNLIPQPKEVVEHEGSFVFTAHTQVAWRGDEAKQVADFFAKKLKTATGRTLKPQKLKKEGRKQRLTADVVEFLITPGITGAEAYRLTVTTEKITAEASTGDGLFWALQTLLQLLPPDVENQAPVKTASRWDVPAVTITDEPRFPYRGVHLDPCRHFLPVSAVKKQLDMLATFKINRLHFHLTEDQGWRIEIKKYPALTGIGAKRLEGEGDIHQGFYTQEEIRDIVAYAAERHITVVPELEIPGHELAAIAAYPDLSCKGESTTPRIIWGVEDIVMCPGKERMFTFLQDVIDEMVPLFPGTLFHIGGDESPRGEWQRCPACQARMKELGYTREAQLQDYVIERIANYLATKGKTIIGWDEILEGGNLEPSAIVMSWRGEEGGIEAAKKGHKAIMTPSSHGFYFDHYQGEAITEPTAIGGYAPLEKVYNYDPVPEELRKEGKGEYILGVQGNNWSEYITGPALLEYRLYPRALALAEIAWSPAEKKDFRDFCRRVDGDATKRMTAHNINFHIPQPEVMGISANRLAFTDRTEVALSTTRPLPILYETNGTSPNSGSPRYLAPIRLNRSATIKTAVMLPGGLIGPVRTIFVTKQPLAPAEKVSGTKPGLRLNVYKGDYRIPEQIKGKPSVADSVITELTVLPRLTTVPPSVRDVENYAAVADGYVSIPADGVYEFSTCNAQLYIDGSLQIDNSRVYAPRDTRENVELALAKGLHRVKVIFVGGIFGG